MNEGIEVEVPPQEEWHGKQPSCLGIHISGCANDMIAYLTDDSKGNRWVVENPAEIHYQKDESKEGSVYKVLFVPASPASQGTLFVPYGELQYIFEPKEDIKKEYVAKFQHSPSTEHKTAPKYEGWPLTVDPTCDTI